jgi:peptidoglycan hydrolase CwlO-like protein
MPTYEIEDLEAQVDLKHRMLKSFHQELSEKDAEIAAFKAEIASLKAQLAARPQDRDREPMQ